MSPTPVPLNIVSAVQNPGLGSFALWRFGLGFQSADERSAHFALFFLVLPIVFHRPTLEFVTSTNQSSGLALFSSKLGKEREQLLAINERALLLRPLTLQSIAVGVSARLLSVRYAACAVRANSFDRKTMIRVDSERLKPLGAGAEKLGLWFSRVNIDQIRTLLQVEF